jgi:magnesium transporter
MSTEILRIQQNQTVQEAKAMVEQMADKKLHGVFVMDQEKLVGMVSMQKLAVSEPAKDIRGIMTTVIPTVNPLEDQELVAQKAIANNWDFIGVVSEDGRLLGGVTLHDILQVVQHEASEDLHMLAGTNVIHPTQTPFATKLKMRLPWLLVTLFGELLVALFIATLFKSTIEKAIILSAFIPAVIAVGGNVGLQSTTIVVRGLGTGVLKPRHVLKVLFSGLHEGLLLGLICGIVAGGFAMLLNLGQPSIYNLGVSILLGMVAGCTATSLVGSVQPIILFKRGMDPAIACGPAITLFNDLFGSVVYLTIAMILNVQAK